MSWNRLPSVAGLHHANLASRVQRPVEDDGYFGPNSNCYSCSRQVDVSMYTKLVVSNHRLAVNSIDCIVRVVVESVTPIYQYVWVTCQWLGWGGLQIGCPILGDTERTTLSGYGWQRKASACSILHPWLARMVFRCLFTIKQRPIQNFMCIKILVGFKFTV